MQPAGPAAYSWHAVIIAPTAAMKSIVLELVDSRGLVISGCFNVVLVNVSNPPPPVGGAPPRSATTYRQTYSQCAMALQLFTNDPWGGTWSVSGTAAANGRTAAVSGSGTVPATS